MSYDLNKAGFKNKKYYFNPYDLNNAGFGKKNVSRKNLERKVRGKFSPYDLNQVGGFKNKK